MINLWPCFHYLKSNEEGSVTVTYTLKYYDSIRTLPSTTQPRTGLDQLINDKRSTTQTLSINKY